LDKKGRILGLAFADDPDHSCPLVDRKGVRYKRRYMANSIQVWEQLLEIFPEEKELFMDESRRRRKRAKRRGKKVKIHTPDGLRKIAP
jgi:hypothetical protein